MDVWPTGARDTQDVPRSPVTTPPLTALAQPVRRMADAQGDSPPPSSYTTSSPGYG